MAADAAQRGIMGDAWARQNEEQLAANERDHPMAADFGKMFPFLISALGGQGKKVIDGGGKVLGRTITKSGEKAVRFAYARGLATRVPMVERMAQNVASFERAGLSQALQQKYVEGKDVSVTDAAARGLVQGVAMGIAPVPVSRAVGLLPVAREVLRHAGWRGVTDSAAMTLSNGIYDATVHGKPLTWGDTVDAQGRTVPGMRTELGANLPAFVLQQLVMSGLHRGVEYRAGKKAEKAAAALPAKRPFRSARQNVIDAEIAGASHGEGRSPAYNAPDIPARLAAPAPDAILTSTDPARLARMHPAEYQQWLKEHVDLTPTGEISSPKQLESVTTAITAARGRGDKHTEQTLIGQIHAARQPTDWTPEKLAAQGVHLAPDAVAELNTQAEAFNQALSQKKSWLGLPETPPTVSGSPAVSSASSPAINQSPAVTPSPAITQPPAAKGPETIPLFPDPASPPASGSLPPAQVFDSSGNPLTSASITSPQPDLPLPAGFSSEASSHATTASEDSGTPAPATGPTPAPGVTSLARLEADEYAAHLAANPGAPDLNTVVKAAYAASWPVSLTMARAAKANRPPGYVKQDTELAPRNPIQESNMNSASLDSEMAKMVTKKTGDLAKKTSNSPPRLPKNAAGGIDFTGHPDLFPPEPGKKNTVTISYTGKRRQDYAAANKAAGHGETQQPPQDYTWHHLDDYDPITNTGTMQLVRTDTHRANSHKGGVHQYEKATGKTYKN